MDSNIEYHGNSLEIIEDIKKEVPVKIEEVPVSDPCNASENPQ